MKDKADQEKMTRATIKKGKDLSKEEIDFMNLYRKRVFNSEDVYNPSPDNKDWNNVFVLVKDYSGEILSFARLHPIELRFSGGNREVYCITGLVSSKKGLGYGKLAMEEIRVFVDESGKTAIGFCETDLLSFYRKCGSHVLSPEDNRFVYVDNEGKMIPGIVPGEVIYYSGKDGVMEEILASEDKIVKVKKNHYE